MTQAKHTPGPWTLETVITLCGICHKIGPFPWRKGKDNHACIYVDYPGHGPIENENLANARLIVVAPKLLDVLENVLADFGSDSPLWDTTREIIAEARGQS